MESEWALFKPKTVKTLQLDMFKTCAKLSGNWMLVRLARAVML